jgi:cell division protein FtsB
MRKTMTIKGFIVILTLVLAVFLTLHLIMKGDMNRKAEHENELRQALSRLQEEEKDLKNQLNLVGTDSYIISSARENYAFLKEGEIRFEFSNPEALYSYSEEELRILVDEVAD